MNGDERIAVEKLLTLKDSDFKDINNYDKIKDLEEKINDINSFIKEGIKALKEKYLKEYSKYKSINGNLSFKIDDFNEAFEKMITEFKPEKICEIRKKLDDIKKKITDGLKNKENELTEELNKIKQRIDFFNNHEGIEKININTNITIKIELGDKDTNPADVYDDLNKNLENINNQVKEKYEKLKTIYIDEYNKYKDINNALNLNIKEIYEKIDFANEIGKANEDEVVGIRKILDDIKTEIDNGLKGKENELKIKLNEIKLRIDYFKEQKHITINPINIDIKLGNENPVNDYKDLDEKLKNIKTEVEKKYEELNNKYKEILNELKNKLDKLDLSSNFVKLENEEKNITFNDIAGKFVDFITFDKITENIIPNLEKTITGFNELCDNKIREIQNECTNEINKIEAKIKQTEENFKPKEDIKTEEKSETDINLKTIKTNVENIKNKILNVKTIEEKTKFFNDIKPIEDGINNVINEKIEEYKKTCNDELSNITTTYNKLTEDINENWKFITDNSEIPEKDKNDFKDIKELIESIQKNITNIENIKNKENVILSIKNVDKKINSKIKEYKSDCNLSLNAIYQNIETYKNVIKKDSEIKIDNDNITKNIDEIKSLKNKLTVEVLIKELDEKIKAKINNFGENYKEILEKLKTANNEIDKKIKEIIDRCDSYTIKNPLKENFRKDFELDYKLDKEKRFEESLKIYVKKNLKKFEEELDGKKIITNEKKTTFIDNINNTYTEILTNCNNVIDAVIKEYKESNIDTLYYVKKKFNDFTEGIIDKIKEEFKDSDTFIKDVNDKINNINEQINRITKHIEYLAVKELISETSKYINKEIEKYRDICIKKINDFSEKFKNNEKNMSIEFWDDNHNKYIKDDKEEEEEEDTEKKNNTLIVFYMRSYNIEYKHNVKNINSLNFFYKILEAIKNDEKELINDIKNLKEIKENYKKLCDDYNIINGLPKIYIIQKYDLPDNTNSKTQLNNNINKVNGFITNLNTEIINNINTFRNNYFDINYLTEKLNNFNRKVNIEDLEKNYVNDLYIYINKTYQELKIKLDEMSEKVKEIVKFEEDNNLLKKITEDKNKDELRFNTETDQKTKKDYLQKICDFKTMRSDFIKSINKECENKKIKLRESANNLLEAVHRDYKKIVNFYGNLLFDSIFYLSNSYDNSTEDLEKLRKEINSIESIENYNNTKETIKDVINNEYKIYKKGINEKIKNLKNDYNCKECIKKYNTYNDLASISIGNKKIEENKLKLSDLMSDKDMAKHKEIEELKTLDDVLNFYENNKYEGTFYQYYNNGLHKKLNDAIDTINKKISELISKCKEHLENCAKNIYNDLKAAKKYNHITEKDVNTIIEKINATKYFNVHKGYGTGDYSINVYLQDMKTKNNYDFIYNKLKEIRSDFIKSINKVIIDGTDENPNIFALLDKEGHPYIFFGYNLRDIDNRFYNDFDNKYFANISNTISKENFNLDYIKNLDFDNNKLKNEYYSTDYIFYKNISDIQKNIEDCQKKDYLKVLYDKIPNTKLIEFIKDENKYYYDFVNDILYNCKEKDNKGNNYYYFSFVDKIGDSPNGNFYLRDDGTYCTYNKKKDKFNRIFPLNTIDDKNIKNYINEWKSLKEEFKKLKEKKKKEEEEKKKEEDEKKKEEEEKKKEEEEKKKEEDDDDEYTKIKEELEEKTIKLKKIKDFEDMFNIDKDQRKIQEDLNFDIDE